MSDTTASTDQASKPGTRSFEDSLEALHQIVEQLERGSLALDDTIQKFREGSALAAECLRQIEEAELRVTELSMGSSGEPPALDLFGDETR